MGSIPAEIRNGVLLVPLILHLWWLRFTGLPFWNAMAALK